MSELEADPEVVRGSVGVAASADLFARLHGSGSEREDAIQDLHALMLRASRHQLGRLMASGYRDDARREEIAYSAADEATMLVLDRLDTFEGRSRFTTWAYKFAILQTATESRRLAWREGQVSIEVHDVTEAVAGTPERDLEERHFVRVVFDAMNTELTAHQREVMVAVAVDGVPTDVVAERLGTTRNAIYKVMHDARRRLRRAVVDREGAEMMELIEAGRAT
jgi:RNA polymerase sigma-70 factor (ECF subfamily)